MPQLQLTTQQIDEIPKLSNKIIDDEFVIYAYGFRTKGKTRPYSDLNLLEKSRI